MFRAKSLLQTCAIPFPSPARSPSRLAAGQWNRRVVVTIVLSEPVAQTRILPATVAIFAEFGTALRVPGSDGRLRLPRGRRGTVLRIRDGDNVTRRRLYEKGGMKPDFTLK